MRIQSLKLRGAIGIMKGQGAEDVGLDLSGMAGLVAFDGPNGKGKSTILENLSPYPQLASRKGALSHHFGLRDSFRDLIFTFNGDEIRTLIKIDSGSNATEGFVWVNNQSQVDGKITNYKAFINELLGSPSLFFSSVFCAQNSTKMSEMTKGELNTLFAEFLRLDRLIMYETSAKQAVNILAGTESRIIKEIETLLESAKGMNDLKEKLRDAEKGKECRELRIKEEKEALVRVEKRIGEGSRIVTANEALRQRIKETEEACFKRQDKIESSSVRYQADLSLLDDKISDMIEKIKSRADILAKKDEIFAAVAKVSNCELELELLNNEAGQVREALTEIRASISEARKAYDDFEVRLVNIRNDPELSALSNDLKHLKEQSAILEQRDPECRSEICGLIVKALKDRAEIPIVEEKRQKMSEANEKAVEEIALEQKEARKALEALQVQEAEKGGQLQSINERVSILEVQRKAHKDLSEKEPEIKTAEADMEHFNAMKAEFESQRASVVKKYKERSDEDKRDLAEILATIENAKASIDNEAEADIAVAEQEASDLRKGMEASESVLREYIAHISRLKESIERKGADEKKLAVLQEEKNRVAKEVSDWKYLKDGCSRDGLRALEIDGVVPAITYETNEILAHSDFGTIKIVTQDPENGKEVFWIKVIDDDGEEVLLEWRSGGEKIWPLQALRLGMTLISKRKSGHNYSSAFSDELDGPLDVENAKRFVNLYPEFMKRGSFETMYFISHKPECVDMADHRIIFNGKGVEIER